MLQNVEKIPQKFKADDGNQEFAEWIISSAIVIEVAQK